MVRLKWLALIATAIFMTVPVTHAESLIIDGLDESGATAMERPKRGMSMTNVESKWGTPAAKFDAIGDPPISRWEYSGFVVYFEYSHVIHSVVAR
ncbi:MAG: hypothetical protein OEU86_01330 [Gammaproteobacteria bacterium]|nr:hypothetical protein [Gammaproteobacteria bacterium]